MSSLNINTYVRTMQYHYIASFSRKYLRARLWQLKNDQSPLTAPVHEHAAWISTYHSAQPSWIK